MFYVELKFKYKNNHPKFLNDRGKWTYWFVMAQIFITGDEAVKGVEASKTLRRACDIEIKPLTNIKKKKNI